MKVGKLKRLWSVCNACCTWAVKQIKEHPWRTAGVVATAASPAIFTWPVTLGMAVATGAGSLFHKWAGEEFAVFGGMLGLLLGGSVLAGGLIYNNDSLVPSCAREANVAAWVKQMSTSPARRMEGSSGACTIQIETATPGQWDDKVEIVRACAYYPAYAFDGAVKLPGTGVKCWYVNSK